MLVKDLLNWKELDDEQKAATKKKLADAAKIGAGFAAGVGAVYLGGKALDKIYPNVNFSVYKGEDNNAFIALEQATKKGQVCPIKSRRLLMEADTFEDAQDILGRGADFFKEAIATRESEAFNDAITDALN